MARQTFSCIDGHTCGNPVRLVTSGAPELRGTTMSEKRQDFIQHYDWIRRALMLEPRGHSMMSGGILYPPLRADSDASLLFIETSGCLPMCGHGTIGCVTLALQNDLITPNKAGQLKLDVPAGQLQLEYTQAGDLITSVKIFNIASYLAVEGLAVNCPVLGELTVDIAYGGNFYAIVEAQKNYTDVNAYAATELLHISPLLRAEINKVLTCVHPEDKTIQGVSHILWTGVPRVQGADARNAVFYGDSALDRSPCGTGTSARMAQLYARDKLAAGDCFVHESIIGSLFTGKIEDITTVGKHAGILPSIEGWAKMTGVNNIIVDDDDPYVHGFVVT